ncbi:GspH/FimT family pseudopilin [Desulfonatronum parangueonense]
MCSEKTSPKNAYNQNGVGLVELLVVIAMMATLFAIALPRMNMIDKSRLNGAARVVWSDMQHARMMAIKKNNPIHVLFTSTGYHFYISENNDKAFERDLASEYKGISLNTSSNSITFNSNTSVLIHNSTNATIQIELAGDYRHFIIYSFGNIGVIQ